MDKTIRKTAEMMAGKTAEKMAGKTVEKMSRKMVVTIQWTGLLDSWKLPLNDK